MKFSINDDGKGFDIRSLETDEKGMGIIGMRERAESCGGIISLKSEPGNGTMIKITIPIKNLL